MPIRPELRHFYRGAAWREARARILIRARNRCEQCGKRAGERVWVFYTSTDGEPDEFYTRSKHSATTWRSCLRGGARVPKTFSLRGPQWIYARRIRVKVGVAHLDGNPANNADDNLKALCDWCHLRHDAPQHKQTRAARKDAARPIQWEGTISL